MGRRKRPEDVNRMIQESHSLRREYRLRTAVPGRKSLEVTFPYEVVEREAQKVNLTVEEFCDQYMAIALFDGFDGVFYIFRRRNNGNTAGA